MRVVERAKSYKITCPRCLSILEFVLDDIHNFDKFSGYSKGVIYCPVCHEEIEAYTSGNGMNNTVKPNFEPHEGECCEEIGVKNGK